jgi:hypothetical protein
LQRLRHRVHRRGRWIVASLGEQRADLVGRIAQRDAVPAFRLVYVAALALETLRMGGASGVSCSDQSSVSGSSVPVELIDGPRREAWLVERTNRRTVRTLGFCQGVARRCELRQRELVQVIDLGGEVGRVS